MQKIGVSLPLGPLLLAAVVLVAYLNAFEGTWQFDDFRAILGAPSLGSVSAWWQALPGIRPILKFSYALNLTLPEAWRLAGFHAVNISLHLINALLVFALMRRFSVGTIENRECACPALVAALLFAVHPVHTEAVTYLSGRSMSLMGVFYLGSILTYFSGRQATSVILAALALGVRETALTLPIALMLLEKQRNPTMSFMQLLRGSSHHWLLMLIAAVMLFAIDHARYLASISFQTRGVFENLITQSGAVLYLLGQLLQPWAMNSDPHLPVFDRWTAGWALAVTALSSLSLWAVWRWRNDSDRSSVAHWLAFGVLWALLHLAPTNSFVPRLDIANERHLYLATPFFYFAVALFLVRNRARVMFVAVPLVAGLILATHARNEVYANEITFWSDVLRHNAVHVRALNNLGYAYAQAGQVIAAMNCYEQGLALAPTDFKLMLNRRDLCLKHAALLKSHCD